MRKLVQFSAICLSLLVTQYGYTLDANQAAQNTGSMRAYDGSSQYNYQNSGRGYGNQFASQGQYANQYASQNDGAAPQDQACGDQAAGECWCLYVHYEPCYYTTKRCVEECIPCKKRCCRDVPKYYEVQRCKMVPQYYTETACKYEKEYYEVDDVKTCKKWVCDTHCQYVPKYYWKHTCGETAPAQGCAPQGCASGACGQ